MDELNTLFLDFNKRERQLVLQNSPVIILLTNDILYVYVYGVLVITQKLDLTTYHMIKNVTHYILYNLVSKQKNESLEQVGKILTNEKIMHNGINVSKVLLNGLESNTKPFDFSLIMKICAEMYSSKLHNTVQEVKEIIFNSQISTDEWNRMIVCVTGPPSPRPGHSAMQYFQRLTGSVTSDVFSPTISESEQLSKQNRRVYYIENVYECDKVLEIMAQLEVERNIFDSIVPMKTDIMAYDTKEYLKNVCKK